MATRSYINGPDVTGGNADAIFISLSGSVQQPAQQVEELAREGKDGHAFRLLGKKSEVAEFIGTVDLANAAAEEVLYARLRNFVGNLVTLVDDHDRRYNRLMFRRVTRMPAQRLGLSIGGTQGSGATHLVSYRMEVQYPRGT